MTPPATPRGALLAFADHLDEAPDDVTWLPPRSVARLIREHAEQYPAAADGPDVVTICGSMRFFAQMLKVAADMTARGIVVLAPFSVVALEDQTGDLKVRLDRLHFRKIDMSSGIVVVTDEAGYIGESTRREMAYAERTGKRVDVLATTYPADL
jgi:hypothetical protein